MSFASQEAKSGITGVLGISYSYGFFLNLLMSTSLGLVWTLMNSLQIIVHLPLINLPFPMIAVQISVILMTIASFDVLPHEKFNKVLFNFGEVKSPDIRF